MKRKNNQQDDEAAGITDMDLEGRGSMASSLTCSLCHPVIHHLP